MLMKKCTLVTVMCAALFYTLPLKVRAQSKLQVFDDQVLINLADARTPDKTNFWLFITNHNNAVNIAVPAGLFAGGVLGGDKVMRQNAGYIATSSAVTFLLTTAIKKIVRRPRPFNNIKINAISRPSSYSFPSGHTSSAFTTATALSQAYPKWYVVVPSYLWAGSIGYSRMYLGVHYPTDVGVGALLGTGTALSLRSMRGNN